MANGWGGARANAGRKKKQELYGPEITALERQIADRLPRLLDNMLLLADGGYEQISETWEPAGLIDREEVDFDAKGMPVRRRVPAFPELPADQLVCIRRTRSIAAPDRAANQYLIDRIAGKPTIAVEADVEVNAGDELKQMFADSVAKIYERGDE